MKIKSKIGDGMFIGLVVFAILTLAFYVVWVVTTVWWPAITLTAILLLIIAPVYFATYYELTRSELRIYSGILGKTIPYRAIISMTDAESIAPAFCLSSRRILIRYMEGEDIKSAYVSPANREQFRDLLNAEISKSTEIYRDVPKTTLDMAVEKARKTQIPLSRPEERAVKIANEEQLEADRKSVNEQLKRLDEVIEANATRNPDEAPLAQRKKAENKLLAKIRKLKDKKERNAKKAENAKLKEQQKAEKAEKKALQEKQKAEKQAEIQAKREQAKKEQENKKDTKKNEKEPQAKNKEPETPEQHKKRLEEEKAKLKAAIENAKKDQYVPPKKQSAKEATPEKKESEEKAKEQSTEQVKAEPAKATKTKKAQKKEKVEEAKKSNAVVKKGKQTK